MLWRRREQGGPSPEQIRRLLEVLDGLLTLVSASPLVGRASGIACALNHPFYDCLYLAVTESRHAILVTVDRALSRRAASAGFAVEQLPLVT